MKEELLDRGEQNQSGRITPGLEVILLDCREKVVGVHPEGQLPKR